MNEREHEQDLARLVASSLDRQVRGLDREPLDLGAVQRRARSVRRRRRALAVGAATLVAAVVVPVALALGGDADPSRGEQGIDPAGDPTLAVDAAATPAFLQGSQVVLGDGRTVDTGLPPQSVQQLAVLGDDRVVLAVRGSDGAGGSSVVVVGADGEQARYPASTTLALRTSPDRSLVAWTDGDDRPQVLEAGVAGPTALPALTDDADVGSLLVGVGGSGCADGGCRVWAVSGARADLVADADGVREVDLPDGLVLSDVHAPAGDVLVMAASETSEDPDRQPCAVLLEPDGDQRGRTCDAAYLRFSPDGTRLRGTTSGTDPGSTGVTVLDTDLRTLATVAPVGARLSAAAFADDGSLLTVEVSGDGDAAAWSLVRHAVPDPGSSEVVVGPVTGPDFPPLLQVPD